MTEHLDSTAPEREGEQLDRERLVPYLKQRIMGMEGPVEIEQFPSGHSNLTYLVRASHREVVLRRPPFGSRVRGAHDMGREHTVLSRLHGAYAPAPEPLLYCEDESIIGAPFYVMERVKGVVLRSRPPRGLEFSPETVRRCCEAFVENLAVLHAQDYVALRLDELRRPGRYVERQVNGWSQRYAGSQTDDIPDIATVEEWLRGRIPDDVDAVLIHNDYKWDNVVLDPVDMTRIVGVLDWEMATIGDPLADLGTTLSYWIEPGDDMEMETVQCFLTGLPGAMTRREVAAHYGEVSGRNVEDILFYYVLGLLKLAVIVQQIYYRYAQGHTRDPRFAGMIDMVRLLGRKAAGAIESGRV